MPILEIPRIQKPPLGVPLDPAKTSDFLGFWPFNENGGGRAYNSLGRFRGDMDGLSWVADYIDFPGSGVNNEIDFGGSINSLIVDPVTILIGLNIAASGDVVFMNREAFNGAEGIEIFTNTNDVAIRGSGGTAVTTTPNVTPYGTWHDLAFVFDGAVGSIYIDGRLNVSGAIEAVTASAQNYCYLGRYGAAVGTAPFLGKMKYCVIVSRTLSASEIADFAANPWQSYQPILLPFAAAAPVGVAMPIISRNGIHSQIFGGQVITGG